MNLPTHKLLPLAAVVDRFSQQRYREISKYLLVRAGVEIEGLPLWVSPRIRIDLSEPGSIRLGDRCVISHDVLLLTHDFSIDRAAERLLSGYDRSSEYVRRSGVAIGDQAFIGIRSIIMPGVEVGEGAIVASGSVVTKNVEPDSVVGGNPARKLSTTDELVTKSLSKFSSQRRRA
jgi:acetyltransferase-like isoleucine patch superfamily enzyme